MRFYREGLLCLCLFGIGGSRAAVAQYYAVPNQPRTVTVIAEGEVRVPPDEVILTLGVETDAMELERATEKNNEIVQRAIESIKRQGVLPRHVQTDFVSIEPRHDTINGRREFLGYYVRKTIVVTLKNVRLFDALLNGAVRDGVNYVLGINFRTTRLAAHREQARQLAIRLAKRKAVQLAQETNQALGPPRSIHEHSSGWNYHGYYGGNQGWGRRTDYAAQAYMGGGGGFRGQGSGGQGSAFEPGQVVVTSAVTAMFDLAESRPRPARTNRATKGRRARR